QRRPHSARPARGLSGESQNPNSLVLASSPWLEGYLRRFLLRVLQRHHIRLTELKPLHRLTCCRLPHVRSCTPIKTFNRFVVVIQHMLAIPLLTFQNRFNFISIALHFAPASIKFILIIKSTVTRSAIGRVRS